MAAATTPVVKVKLPVVRVIEVAGDFIKLDSLLKLAGIAQTGGEAKIRIAEGEITVDGEVETQRGRKLRDGAVVRGVGQAVRIKTMPSAEPAAEEQENVCHSERSEDSLPAATKKPKVAKSETTRKLSKPPLPFGNSKRR